MKVKKVGKLIEKIYTQSFDQIAIWSDGEWSDVGSGFGGNYDGNNPRIRISRSNYYDLTRREIKDLIRQIQDETGEFAHLSGVWF